jgi:hypothetical protein
MYELTEEISEKNVVVFLNKFLEYPMKEIPFGFFENEKLFPLTDDNFYSLVVNDPQRSSWLIFL